MNRDIIILKIDNVYEIINWMIWLFNLIITYYTHASCLYIELKWVLIFALSFSLCETLFIKRISCNINEYPYHMIYKYSEYFTQFVILISMFDYLNMELIFLAKIPRKSIIIETFSILFIAVCKNFFFSTVYDSENVLRIITHVQ